MVELMVAAGILALMVAFSSVIFRFSIDAHRVASANAEIMQKLRVITAQLNDDFRGLRKDAPLLIWFEQDTIDNDPNRYDQIMFFADGDFSSLQLYLKTDNKPIPIDDLSDLDQDTMTVRGNVARINYALAQNSNGDKAPQLDDKQRILARRAHILTADTRLIEWPSNNFDDFGGYELVGVQQIRFNDAYEHDTVSLSRWKIASPSEYDQYIIPATFNEPPVVDKDQPRTFHLLMSEAVGSFAIQLAYWEENIDTNWELRWFPSDDPDDEPATNDSHFVNIPSVTQGQFGVFFNIDDPGRINEWYSLEEAVEDALQPLAVYNVEAFPAAIKFTFRLYDSKEVIEGGREFTHIIYLED